MKCLGCKGLRSILSILLVVASLDAHTTHRNKSARRIDDGP
jgi:hypothetical protein